MKKVLTFTGKLPMGNQRSLAFNLDTEVIEDLLKKASEYSKTNNTNSSVYVNDLIKWALENYKENNVKQN